MQIYRSITCALLASAALAWMPTASFAQSLQDEVAAAYTAWDTAFNAGDAAGLSAAYTEDALFLPPSHDVLNGPAGVSEFFGGIFDLGVTGHKLELIEAQGDGELIIAAARWSADGKDAAGADQPWGGLATHVFERQDDGVLKLRVHTFN